MVLKTKKLLARLAHIAAPQVHIYFHNDESYYDHSEKSIYIDKEYEEDCGFMRHLCEVHKVPWAYKIHDYIWTVLHEVGHFYTYSKYVNSKKETAVRKYFAKKDFDTVNNSVKLQDLYYNLDSEYAATEYAIQFIKRHYKTMRKLSLYLSKIEG